ncbi:glycoside hydrolase family 2 protein [Cellvibrio sp. NN19]|uniref:glycoside hydrolase family 2 protein n=1 Tax=Cellvibrio chitinivorans TaxID=3102792 RepID=UPI002B400845|nr:glycoside hydrolase family 2 TIM barrel-domain containing protein [Cellvibrio sp. NN19]
MKRLITRWICAASLLMSGVHLSAAEQPLQAYTRDATSLNSEWKIIVDPYENGYYNYRYEPFDQQQNPSVNAFFTDSKQKTPADLIEYDFDKAETLQVPGDWNTQKEKLYYYEGSVWYRKKFDAPAGKKSDRQYIYFGAVNYRADVYLNGKKLGVHIGGFTPFHYEVTGKLKSKNNSLIIKVDNKRYADAVPTLNTDWWNYGGITREVKLINVPNTFIRDYKIALTSHSDKTVAGSVMLDGAKGGEKIQLRLPELDIQQTLTADNTGRVSFSFSAPNAQFWSPENPKLYAVKISSGSDTLTDTIGLRTIETQGKQLLLNGKPLFLRGISIHEEYAADGGGRVSNTKAAKTLLTWAKELNANFVRLAHYPHNEDMVRLADQMGLLVWSEIPVYWTINWKNEETYKNAEAQLSAMIERDKNRAAVIIWSLANETPVSDARNQFLGRLAQKARSLDKTRLLSAAMEKHYRSDNPNIAVVEDPLAEIVDLVSFNQYIGWYDGLPEKADKVTWQINYNKPVFISEFGGGAKQGYHGDAHTIFTEEFQELLYQKSVKMIDKIDGFVGTSPWILADFRSPRRLLNGVQDDFNRKGLYSNEGVKKKAFFVLKDYYDKKEKESH